MCLFVGVKGRGGVSYRAGNATYVGVGTTSPVIGSGSGRAMGSVGGPAGGGSTVRTFDRRHRRRSSSCTTDTAINGTMTMMTSAACVAMRAPVEIGCSTAV